MVLLILNITLAMISILVAWRWGGGVERRAALILALMWAITLAGHLVQAPAFATIDHVAAVEDGLGFLGFAYLGIRFKRVWPLAAAALQLLSVGAHVVRGLDLAVRPIVYAWMKSGPTWGVMVLVLIGSLGHLRHGPAGSGHRTPPD